MPARVAVVLRERMLAGKTAEALISAGYDAITLTNAMAALRALEAAKDIELLITSAYFPGHQPNGLTLARMTRLSHPNLKVIFADGPETEAHVRHGGAFIATPTTPEFIAEVADKLMKAAA
jgi:DNA-binding NtrC family response regulator